MGKKKSEAQRLLDEGKYIITPFGGYWYMLLPASSWLVTVMQDNIFRTGFDVEVPETKVREFYCKRLNVLPGEIAKVV